VCAAVQAVVQPRGTELEFARRACIHGMKDNQNTSGDGHESDDQAGLPDRRRPSKPWRCGTLSDRGSARSSKNPRSQKRWLLDQGELVEFEDDAAHPRKELLAWFASIGVRLKGGVFLWQ